MVPQTDSGYKGGMKSKTFRPYDLDQPFLLPPSMREWLPAGHLVYMILDVVAALDLSEVLKRYEGAKGGRPPYHPRMMVALLLYGYATGVRSSRKLERACYEQIPFRVLTADQQPDHDTIAAFRVLHLGFLEDLFVQSVRLCGQAGLVKLGHVAIDGSKVKANASRHKAMSYAYMRKNEEKLREEIAAILAEAEKIDRLEDEKFGKGNRGDELPEELRTREGRLKKIQEAKAALEREAREAAEAKRQAHEENDRKLREVGKKPRKKKPVSDEPSPTAQRNFTDPDARMMKSGSTKAFQYSYNAQIAVDDEAQVIVATDLSQCASDAKELQPLVDQIASHLQGASPKRVSADTGYFSEDNVDALEGAGIDPFIATKRHRHGDEPPPPPRGRIPRSLTKRQRMERKLTTRRGRRTYSRRKAIVEPVFGQIKEPLGFRSFLLRGHLKARGEWNLISAAHNLLKLIRSQSPPRALRALATPG